MLSIFLHTFISKQETILSSQHNLLLFSWKTVFANLIYFPWTLHYGTALKNKQRIFSTKKRKQAGIALCWKIIIFKLILSSYSHSRNRLFITCGYQEMNSLLLYLHFCIGCLIPPMHHLWETGRCDTENSKGKVKWHDQNLMCKYVARFKKETKCSESQPYALTTKPTFFTKMELIR